MVGYFVTWCEQNHLQLNMTKELVVDLRRAEAPVIPVLIQGVRWDTVENYKYLGVHTNSNVESVVADLYAVVCWGNRLRAAEANRLNKLI